MTKYNLGLDIGSTTIKMVLFGENDNIIFSDYRRHFSDIKKELQKLFEEIEGDYGEYTVKTAVTGSGGIYISRLMHLPFVQEVVAGACITQKLLPNADVIIEIGGEDAKITYLKPAIEQRMNGICAGGTGAFIDQMATLLNTDPMGLNELAQNYKTIYPIAARCGVFAKTDVQALLNEGATKEDIAASMFQAIVNQTILGLACGRPIRGVVTFLGGPLHYLTELRERFVSTLNPKEVINPENSHLYVAMGAAFMASKEIKIKDLSTLLQNCVEDTHETRRLPALFNSKEEYDSFITRHNANKAKYRDLATYSGDCFLGIDAGSTTIKAVLVTTEGEILYTYYKSNKGSPLDSAVHILKEIYDKLPSTAKIAGSCVTGYGEAIIKEALMLDFGEVETVAHYKGAEYFNKNIDFIIDIGGQDMKCLKIKKGVIDGIILNEACSSGCGSFLETFANSLELTINEFANEAQAAKAPADLGTRCTVFMNSKVKQAQKEGATVGEISAGLSYSVIKNMLYKLIKIKDTAQLGENIVVQGGTFKNDAILRTLELELKKEVIRPDIAELMGAFGSALIARKNKGNSSTVSLERLKEFTYKSSFVRCAKCENCCMLTVTTFDGGRKFISGNKCEKGAGATHKEELPNMFDYKMKRAFSYEPLKNAPLGEIGIPRGLNMFDNYPFWFTLLTSLGFRVILSDTSSHSMFMKGIETIPSDTVCFPAKLVHGHIQNLVDKGVKRIFYPCIPYEEKEFEGSKNHYNCPVVTSYPEVIKNNMDVLREENIDYINAFFALDEPTFIPTIVHRTFGRFGISKKQAKEATMLAYAELKAFKQDIKNKGSEIIAELNKTGKTGIVLVGRPYHIDSEINHGIPELINSYGLAVLTEDSVAHLGELPRPIRAFDQWAFHTRLYEAAAAVGKEKCLQLVQLNSFGCGLDAITTDQVQKIVEDSGKIYTLLKIDEISHLGAARIRVRSLIAALEEQDETQVGITSYKPFKRVEFTKEMRKKHKVVCPQMSPIHFQFLKSAFDPTGYDFHVLETVSREDIDAGLKYVNNDCCYPAIVVIGQLINAFLSGELDPNDTSIMIVQTGDGCRATNYVALIRKALIESGYPQVAVVPISFSGLEFNSGLKVSAGFGIRIMMAIFLGDLFQKVLYATRPYEVNKGETDALYAKYVAKAQDLILHTRYFAYQKMVKAIVRDFDNVPRNGDVRPKVGLVGEALVKFHPQANNNAAQVIEDEGGECVVPSLIDFAMFCFYNTKFKNEHLGKKYWLKLGGAFAIWLMNTFKEPMQKALRKSKHFDDFMHIRDMAKLATEVLSTGNMTGEGWFLTSEMMHLIESGTENIICVQPFACLPNHVVAKGMIRGIKRIFPKANIVPVDYDPGSSEVNQINRIKLMIYNAFANMK